MIGKKINQLATELAPVSTDLTIIGDPTTGVSKKITLAQLGAIFSGAVSFYTNLAGFPAVGDINVIYCAKDTQKLYLWSGSAYVEVFPSQALLDTYQLRSEKGNANGYASLDSGGKVPISQLPSSIMEYKGTWNAATNTPTLANGTGDTGDVYICNVAGTVNFGAGPITFAVGDYVIYSGSIWQRSSGAVGTVTSVAATITGDSVTISGSPVTTSGTLAFAFNGTTAQYIRGNGTLETFPSLTGFVPYTGATTNVNLGTHSLSAYDLIINHTSGSGVAASITKGGNGEALTVVKSSGSGNAASITGGVTLLDELHLNTDLADAYIASATNWNAAYNDKINSAAVTGTTTKTLTLTQQDGGTITASWTDDNTDAVTSVFGRTGAVVATSGDYTTAQVTESGNLYFTNARAIASTLTGYTSGAGTITSSDSILSAIQKLNGNIGALTTGVSSVNGLTGAVTLTTSNIAEGTNLYYTEARVSANTDVAANTAARHNAVTIGTANGLSLSTQVLSLGLASTSTTGALSSTDWNTFNNKTSNTGTVTSVGLSSATSGVTIGSTPITTSGTITLAIATASGSQQGLLSSTDWTTFNNKQNALTNPVTGTGTTNYLPKFTGTSTIGNSLVFDNGTNVGIGTASPGYLLDVAGASRSDYHILRSNQSAPTADAFIFRPADNTVAFGTANTERMRLNASGNLGLGVTPSAWVDFKAFELPNIGFLAAAGPYIQMIANGVYNGGANYIYKTSAQATMYAQAVGQHQWFIAPSGTAGNTFTFTQAMTLNASGNLSIGNTNNTYKLDVTGTARFSSFVEASTNFISVALTDSISVGTSTAENAKYNYLGHSGYWGLKTTATGFNFALDTYNGGTPKNVLTITQAGAATFSSSVTATQFIANGNSGGGFEGLRIVNASTGAAQIVLNNSAQSWLVNTRTDNHFSIFNATASTTPFLINTSGNVGIGTTSPSEQLNLMGANAYTSKIRFSYGASATSYYANLGYNSDGNKVYLQIADGGSAANIMTWNYNGNVGIGTTSPNNLLQVGGSVNGIIRIDGAGDGVDFGIKWASSNASIYSNTGSAHLALSTNGSERMRIDASGRLLVNRTASTNTNYYLQVTQGISSSTSVVAQGTLTGYSGAGLFMSYESYGGRLESYDYSTSSWKNIAITPNGGNVGIGITTPSYKLDVNGSFSFTTGGNYLQYASGILYHGNYYQYPSGDNYLLYARTGGALLFGSNDTERMRITSGGLVGIGTATPATRLHVRGASTGTLTSVVYFEDNSTNQNGLAVRAGTGRVDLLATWGGTGINTDLTLTPTNSSGAQNEAMRITSGGNVEIATGSIKTGEPDTGWGRAAIKIGARQSGEAFSSGGYLPVNVDGTVYYINLYSSTP
jgi:hypothetical protein